MRGQANLGKMFDGLRLHEGIQQRLAIGKQAVVGEKDGIVRANKGLKTGPDFFRACGGVFGQGNKAGRHHDLGTDRLIERLAAGGERRRNGRMSMDDGLHVGPCTIHGKMHGDFAGDITQTGELASFEIDDDHVGRLQKRLAASGGACKNTPVIEADREIAGSSRGIPGSMHGFAGADHLPAEIGLQGAHRRFQACAGHMDVYGLFGKVLGHRAIRLSLAGLKSFLMPVPIRSEIINIRPAVRLPTTL